MCCLAHLQDTVACNAQDALLEDMVSSVDIIDLKAIHTSVTGPDGFAEVPIQASAGRVLKVVVAAAPEEHLLPHYLKVGGAGGGVEGGGSCCSPLGACLLPEGERDRERGRRW